MRADSQGQEDLRRQHEFGSGTLNSHTRHPNLQSLHSLHACIPLLSISVTIQCFLRSLSMLPACTLQNSTGLRRHHRVPHGPLDDSRMVDDGIEPATRCRQYVRVRRQPESDIHRLCADECVSRRSGPTEILLVLSQYSCQEARCACRHAAV